MGPAVHELVHLGRIGIGHKAKASTLARLSVFHHHIVQQLAKLGKVALERLVVCLEAEASHKHFSELLRFQRLLTRLAVLRLGIVLAIVLVRLLTDRICLLLVMLLLLHMVHFLLDFLVDLLLDFFLDWLELCWLLLVFWLFFGMMIPVCKCAFKKKTSVFIGMFIDGKIMPAAQENDDQLSERKNEFFQKQLLDISCQTKKYTKNKNILVQKCPRRLEFYQFLIYTCSDKRKGKVEKRKSGERISQGKFKDESRKRNVQIN
ncbi:hypothetical protein BpHYR1_041081 [Brachionus plicatilis]|uniref:Uncharacterized protein n=1 Tax=Brachionus plicatilis TaxID=10195 RepID=A0A3M7QYX2_BRAPC|nr:hypothetical protein BpHYR1_041081 [Brachionus plicatilis]